MSTDFRAKRPYLAEHPTALAMYCSDGRFTEPVEELLRSLGHDRLDTLTMPGGPALLELTSASLGALDAVKGAMSFLIKGHAIRQVALLAHEGCGYYRTRNPYDSAEATSRRQLSDLRSAARWVRTEHAGVTVVLYRAYVTSGRVAFALVEP